MTYKNKISKTYRISLEHLAMIEDLKDKYGMPVSTTWIIENAICNEYIREFGLPDFKALRRAGEQLKEIKETTWVEDHTSESLRFHLDVSGDKEHKSHS